MFTVVNEGSLFMFHTDSPEALDHARLMFADAQWLGNSFAVEPRYAADIVEQLREDGFEVE